MAATSISERQLEIITAAGKILSSSGISGLTIKNLAHEMKFSESAIYRHFKSKEDIIIALLNYLSRSMDDRYSQAINNEQTAEEKFTAIFQNQFSFFKKHPHFVVAVFSDGLMEESDKINKAMSKIMEVKIKHLSPIIAEGRENGTFTTDIKAEELIHIIMGTVRLAMYKWRMADFGFDITKSGHAYIQALLSLIKNK